MAKRKIDTPTEIKIVARLARGDTYQSIKDDLAKEGVDISLSGITDIKQRNSMALEQIKSSLVQHETSKSARILDKARKGLESALDDHENYREDLKKLVQAREDGDIDWSEFIIAKSDLDRASHLTAKDLTTISKEMFNQSQIEAGKPTTITENPEENKRNLMILLKAINDKDEVTMLKTLFPDA